jgi:hypothetical protein
MNKLIKEFLLIASVVFMITIAIQIAIIVHYELV